MTTNTAHSVKDRLLKLSKERREEFNFVLVRYGLERLLYRLSCSSHADEFILKGAMLFTVWAEHPHRATKDLDFHGRGDSSLERLREVFREVCATPVEDDGLVFDQTSVASSRIKEGAEYEGVRVGVSGRLGSAVLSLQVDVGFGDAITPEPEVVKFPSLLEQPAARMRIYPRETVVAEKLHAIVYLGMANSRMKDFFDLSFLCREFSFDGETVLRAVRATFERRRTRIPEEMPVGLTQAFAIDPAKQAQWRAFLRRSGVSARESLSEVIGDVARFLLPVLRAATEAGPPVVFWPAAGPWSFGPAVS